MESISPTLKFFLNLTITQALIARRFDGQLSLHSLSLNDFMILFHLSQAPEKKLRRIDLAGKVGLSASAITKKISPLEKIGVVKKEANVRDARVSFVKLTQSGSRVLEEAMDSAEMAAGELYPKENEAELEQCNDILLKLGGSVK